MFEKIYQDHAKWINTTLKFGCTKEEAEDIVGNMYVIIGTMLNKGLNISYGDEVNYYYIYKTLKTSFLQMYNRKKKEKTISLDSMLDIQFIHKDKEVDTKLNVILNNVLNNHEDEYIDYNDMRNIVDKNLSKMHWYDRKVFEMIQDGYTITELSKKTNISYHSLYNTYRKTKQKLIKKVLE